MCYEYQAPVTWANSQSISGRRDLSPFCEVAGGGALNKLAIQSCPLVGFDLSKVQQASNVINIAQRQAC